MSEVYPCFMLDPLDRGLIYLRRYQSGSTCPLPHRYHNTKVQIGVGRVIQDGGDYSVEAPEVEPSDPRWPTHCDCGYAFQESDEKQVFTERLWARRDTGEELTLLNAPVGAMWDAWWFREMGAGPDGLSLVLETPGGPWFIDGQASNCTMKEDTQQRQHHCWIRHGTPPVLTVDKAGVTCAAGAGSIQSGSYHGFLRDGKLVP